MRDKNFEDVAYRQRFGFRKKMIFIPFLILGGLALFSYIVMQLWNNILPEVLHVGSVTYWQAAGILILSKILFGFGGRGGRGGGAPWMRHKMERFKSMSPEEQQRFRDEMRSRCGKWGRGRGGFDWTEPKVAEEAPKPTE